MTDTDPIQKAKTRISEITKQIASLQDEKEEFDKFIATYKKLQGSPLNGVSHSKAPKKSKGDIAIECAIELCQQSEEPVKARDIYELMKQRGVTIKSAVPIPIVSGYLGTSDRLKAIRGKGWIMN